MLRKLAMTALAIGTVAAATGTATAAETVRIETRPFYGATVTLEAGVRVFRPLPADRRVIINPGARTPLSLNFEDSQSVSHNYNYDYSESSDSDDSDDGYTGSGGFASSGDFGTGARRDGRQRSGGLLPGRSHRAGRMGRGKH